MNDNYLWDKSGDPDPHIEELEKILAPLRYQPTPLELPREVRRRNYLPLLAIAAGILIALFAAGLWLNSRTEITPQQEQAKVMPTPPPAPAPVFKNANEEEIKRPIYKKKSVVHNSLLARREREEALAAKEQVMLALRLASEKLKLAQRRTQGPSLNQIKNQHKIG